MSGFHKAHSAHERAIDHFLAKGARISVRDLHGGKDEDGNPEHELFLTSDQDEGGNPEYDLFLSNDRKHIIDACQATDLPILAVYLQPDTDTEYRYLLTFSVIDKGIPDETINDWTVPCDNADQWRIDAEKEFSSVVFGHHPASWVNHKVAARAASKVYQ
ncbi:MAG: hypothetical protein GY815_07265 [Gammaproteobacteria bacterium]|nr:hypothetical protein [Gammaproteobacteria bacterium]